MQIKILMRPRGGELVVPYNYNYQLESAIYSKLNANGISDMLHDGGFVSSHRYKAFVFGSLHGAHTKKDKRFVFSDLVGFEFRSHVFEICDAMQRGLEKEPVLTLFDTKLDVVGASLANTHIPSGEATFRTDSPVTAYRTGEDRKTVYYSPGDSEFVKLLTLNYHGKYLAVTGKQPDDVEIEPILPQNKIVTRFKTTWINCWKGDYIIKGSVNALEFIYNTGLGAKNSQGFGMINVIETD